MYKNVNEALDKFQKIVQTKFNFVMYSVVEIRKKKKLDKNCSCRRKSKKIH